jgi:transposase-like protein
MARRKQTAENTVKNIRRRTRKKYNAEDKIRIVVEGLRGESPPVRKYETGSGQRASQEYAGGAGPVETAGGGTVAEKPHVEKNAERVGGRAVAGLKRYTPEEKREIIHLVEHSALPVKQTLSELQVARSTFYTWYQRYQEEGPQGLQPRKASRQQFWNRIPDPVRQQIVDLALAYPDESPRQLAYRFIDEKGYYVSESSVYRLLKSYDLIQSPVFELITANEQFDNPTERINEMWQTDFTQFLIVGWGWYYLSTVLDDYSRYILAYKLAPSMNASDVEETLQLALDKTGVAHVKVAHRTRLL